FLHRAGAGLPPVLAPGGLPVAPWARRACRATEARHNTTNSTWAAICAVLVVGVLGRDLDNIAANDVETETSPEDRQRVRRTQAAHLRRSRARREGGIQTVDVEGDIGR